MASVDGGQYSISSDGTVQFECNPCKDENDVREAKYFCPECSEYYCESCELSHRRLKATKSHKLLTGSDLTKNAPKKQVPLSVMYCVCNQMHLVEYMCDKHDCLVCSECNVVNHRKCGAVRIEDKCKPFTGTNLDSTITQIYSIEERAVKLKQTQKENLDIFKGEKNECRVETDKLRSQLHVFVDEIADKSLEDLESSSTIHTDELEIRFAASGSTIQRMQTHKKMLQDSKAAADMLQMFVANYRVTNCLKNYTKLIDELEQEDTVKSITFQPAKMLTDMQATLKSLGTVQVADQYICTKTGTVPKSLLTLTSVADKNSDITPPGAMRLTGSTFMPNGDLVVCDFDAKRVIILESKFKEMSKLQLPGQPWDVAVLSDKDVIVSLTLLKTLQTVELKPALKLGHCVALDKKCFGVQQAGKHIFVVCTNDPGEGEIKMLDMEGNVIKRLGLNKDGTYMLRQPFHLAANIAQDRILVSDYETASVVCLSTDGQKLFEYSDAAFCKPRGILLDTNNNFLVCNQDDSSNKADNICKVKSDGTMYTKLLTNTHGILKPYCLSLRNSDGSMVVTCYEKLLVFKLK